MNNPKKNMKIKGQNINPAATELRDRAIEALDAPEKCQCGGKVRVRDESPFRVYSRGVFAGCDACGRQFGTRRYNAGNFPL